MNSPHDPTSSEPPTRVDSPETITAVPSSDDPNTATWQDSPTNVAAALPPGYRFLQALGHGGMGRVWAVVDEQLETTFALKMIHPGTLSPVARERFRQEAKAMVELDHPHIARIYSYGEHRGVPFLTMRYLRGGTLAAKIDAFHHDPRAAVNMVGKVVSATAYLHERGFVHRDLKPHNILLDDLGEPYVSDFGLVKSMAASQDTERNPVLTTTDAPLTEPPASDSHTPPLTATGAILGTRVYMSPEQASGNIAATGPKSDAWALGVMLYEILVGERPFQHTDPDSLMQLILSEDPIPPHQIVIDFDPTLERIILACLAKNPDARPTARALHEALMRWLNPTPTPRRRRALFVGTPIVLLVLGGLLWARWPKPKASEPTPTVAEIRQQLRDRVMAGEKVYLVDAAGTLLVPLNFLFDEELIRPVAVGSPCAISYSSLTYAELLDDVGVPHYSFAAEVQCAMTGPRSTGGLYAARLPIASNDHTSHFLVELRYTDPRQLTPKREAPDPMNNKAVHQAMAKTDAKTLPGVREAQLRRITIPPNGQANTHKHQLDGVPRSLSLDDQTPDGWRPLAIHSTTPGYDFYWHQQKIVHANRQLTPAIQVALFGNMRHPIDPAPVFQRPGGLGLIIQGGVTSFRNVWVQRLD